ncbi:hypothetical protein CC1G_14929 [Coprinopsis cinerea okayama7|uniref:Uncharacterized protein n=1 Tax=Coprinopsis cinerea (strain Okayama-7 / 130 / ATCC MYA-4618 / FGSC 9003) TaxID=240176 RepID=D6RPB1_COPC7|nr:hypothetical protein CC1G_14929 [Coprinopsis cinerea okayama7\|eukprot:XP_002910598.1 hypothetical protein CC1G_14929 [Coprinopsis cinerea okayama7\
MNTTTGGRLFQANGDIWYSPNCQIPIEELPPPAREHSMDRNPFKPTSRLSHFHSPRWWTRAYGWTSFIPIVPDTYSTALQSPIPRTLS